MNRTISNCIDNMVPTPNKDTMEGIGGIMMGKVLEKLDKLVHSSLSTTKDLYYKGYLLSNPKDNYKNQFKSSAFKYEILQTNIVKVTLVFEYQDTKIYKDVYLPFVVRGSLFLKAGSYYSIIPVLTDTVLSVNNDCIFVRLLRDKFHIHRKGRTYHINNHSTIEYMLYTHIYKPTGVVKGKNAKVTPVAIYNFIYYGVHRYIKDVTGVDITIVNTTLKSPVKLNKDIIVFSSNKMPIKNKVTNTVNYNNISVVVKVNQVNDNNLEMLKNCVFSIIYIFDLFPVNCDHGSNILNNGDEDKQKEFWRIVLGKIVGSANVTTERLNYDMITHIKTLDVYIDVIIKESLATIGVNINNFYELMTHVMLNFNKLTTDNIDNNTDINKRYYDIYYYILHDTLIGVNKVVLEYNKRITANKSVLIAEIENIIKINIPSKAVFGLVKNGMLNLAVTTNEISGDLYLKGTLSADDQNLGKGVSREKTGISVPAFIMKIPPSTAYVAAAYNLKKTMPYPWLSLNPYVKIDVKTGKILFTEEEKKEIDRIIFDELTQNIFLASSKDRGF